MRAYETRAFQGHIKTIQEIKQAILDHVAAIDECLQRQQLPEALICKNALM